MRIEALLSFYTAVEEGSFTSAAKKLHLTQPAISMGVKQLEMEYGQPLLIRKPGGGLELTLLGEKVYQTVKDIHLHMEKLELIKKEVSNQLNSEIKIECSATAGIYFLSLQTSLFREIHPDIQISVKYTKADQAIQSITEGNCDLIMLLSSNELLTSSYPKLETVFNWEDRLELIVPKQHPLAEQFISIDDVTKLSFILPFKNSTTRRIIDDNFSKWDKTAKCIIEFNNPEAIKQGVLSLNEPGFVLRSTIQRELELGILSTIPTELNLRCEHLMMSRKHYQTGAIRLFIKFLTQRFESN